MKSLIAIVAALAVASPALAQSTMTNQSTKTTMSSAPKTTTTTNKVVHHKKPTTHHKKTVHHVHTTKVKAHVTESTTKG